MKNVNKNERVNVMNSENKHNYVKKTIKHKSIKHKSMKHKIKSEGSNIGNLYTPDNYNSGDGMLTAVWGPGLWHFLHTMSFNYPVSPTEENKKHYRDFILSLQNVLPCKYCRTNLETNFKSLPLTYECMQSRSTFSLYIYNLHELINTMLKKKSNLTYDVVRERYEHFRARCLGDKPKTPKIFKHSKVKTKKHMGCTEPLIGKKSKCILKIVPQEEKVETFQIKKKIF